MFAPSHPLRIFVILPITKTQFKIKNIAGLLSTRAERNLSEVLAMVQSTPSTTHTHLHTQYGTIWQSMNEMCGIFERYFFFVIIYGKKK